MRRRCDSRGFGLHDYTSQRLRPRRSNAMQIVPIHASQSMTRIIYILYKPIFHSRLVIENGVSNCSSSASIPSPFALTSRIISMFYMPPPNIPWPPPCLPCASPCIFSLTFTLTSKNLDTQRSRQTDSPLLRSASRYDVSMHFAEQDLRRLHNLPLAFGRCT